MTNDEIEAARSALKEHRFRTALPYEMLSDAADTLLEAYDELRAENERLARGLEDRDWWEEQRSQGAHR